MSTFVAKYCKSLKCSKMAKKPKILKSWQTLAINWAFQLATKGSEIHTVYKGVDFLKNERKKLKVWVTPL